jgi:hypothetical protein
MLPDSLAAGRDFADRKRCSFKGSFVTLSGIEPDARSVVSDDRVSVLRLNDVTALVSDLPRAERCPVGLAARGGFGASGYGQGSGMQQLEAENGAKEYSSACGARKRR